MNFSRQLYYEQPIELTSTTPINLGLTFKQYDVGSSVLVLDTTLYGLPSNFSDEKIYVLYEVKSNQFSTSTPIVDRNGERVVTYGTFNHRVPGRLLLEITEEVLENSGQITAEIIIISSDGSQRMTSPAFSFNIEKSLSEISTVRVGHDKITGEVICSELKPTPYDEPLVVPEVEETKTFLSEDFQKNLDSILGGN